MPIFEFAYYARKNSLLGALAPQVHPTCWLGARAPHEPLSGELSVKEDVRWHARFLLHVHATVDADYLASDVRRGI